MTTNSTPSTIEVRELEPYWWDTWCHDCAARVGDPTQFCEEAEAEAAHHRNICPSARRLPTKEGTHGNQPKR